MLIFLGSQSMGEVLAPVLFVNIFIPFISLKTRLCEMFGTWLLEGGGKGQLPSPGPRMGCAIVVLAPAEYSSLLSIYTGPGTVLTVRCSFQSPSLPRSPAWWEPWVHPSHLRFLLAWVRAILSLSFGDALPRQPQARSQK